MWQTEMKVQLENLQNFFCYEKEFKIISLTSTISWEKKLKKRPK